METTNTRLVRYSNSHWISLSFCFVSHLLMAHSSIGLVGGSKRGSEVAKVGLAPDVLLAASLAAEAELFPLF